MSGTPLTAGQEPLLAQATPLQSWVDSWLEYLSANLPTIFIVVAVFAGIMLLVRGGIKQTVIFAIGAGLAFLLLTNLESIAEFFDDELPLPPEAPAVEPTGEPSPEPTE